MGDVNAEQIATALAVSRRIFGDRFAVRPVVDCIGYPIRRIESDSATLTIHFDDEDGRKLQVALDCLADLFMDTGHWDAATDIRLKHISLGPVERVGEGTERAELRIFCGDAAAVWMVEFNDLRDDHPMDRFNFSIEWDR